MCAGELVKLNCELEPANVSQVLGRKMPRLSTVPNLFLLGLIQRHSIAVSPFIKLVGNIFIACLQLLDLSFLPVNVWTVLLIALLQGATQLLCSLQILTQLLHVILSRCHRASLGLNISTLANSLKSWRSHLVAFFKRAVEMKISSPEYLRHGILLHLEHQGLHHLR